VIQLKQIEVRGESDSGPFLGILNLYPGLQVITAPNSYGKSLAVTSVAWCLGLEPIFGLQNNDAACFPVAAREEIELEGHPAARVLSSECSITLLHQDGREVKLSRDIRGDCSIVRVVERSIDGNVRRSKLMARLAVMQDEHGGLQRFLFEWLGWPREMVMTLKGTAVDVYLENLAPLFYINQNEGWTDLQAQQVGRYLQQQIGEVAVEYLLGAIDAVQARVGRQKAVLRDAALRESAHNIADRIKAFIQRHGWEVEWSGYGSVEDVVTRWSLRTLRDVLLQESNVNLVARRTALEDQAHALRRALTTDTIDPANLSSVPAVSQKAVDLKRRRHELNEELRTLRTQHDEFEELVSSLEHRIEAASDVLRLKTTGVGRLDHVECPTCHRELDPATFALTEQSQETVSIHIESLKRDRELMKSNLQAIAARLTGTQAATMRLDGELRDAERALMTVTEAVGTVREQLAKAAADLSSIERALDQVIEASGEIDDLQNAINHWLNEAKATQQFSHAPTDLKRRLDIFMDALRQYLLALGHSAVRPDNVGSLRLDERYIPYLDTRRLRSLGSASDQSRLVAAYTLGLAAASNQIGGLHPGLVLLDEPLQQNPDDPHRDLFVTFLSKQVARESNFQTVLFTFLRQQEIEVLRQQGTVVVAPEGKHFLKLQPRSADKRFAEETELNPIVRNEPADGS
jgi:hypothetical protein